MLRNDCYCYRGILPYEYVALRAYGIRSQMIQTKDLKIFVRTVVTTRTEALHAMYDPVHLARTRIRINRYVYVHGSMILIWSLFLHGIYDQHTFRSYCLDDQAIFFNVASLTRESCANFVLCRDCGHKSGCSVLLFHHNHVGGQPTFASLWEQARRANSQSVSLHILLESPS